jgi:hypothetical protein
MFHRRHEGGDPCHLMTLMTAFAYFALDTSTPSCVVDADFLSS